MQPHGRLIQVHKLDAGDRLQDFDGGLDHAGDTGMPVQRDAQLDWVAEMGLELTDAVSQKQDERRHLERPRAALPLDRRQRRLGELHVATRTPG